MLHKILILLSLFCPSLTVLGQNCLEAPDYLPEDSLSVCHILRNNSAREVSYCGRQFLGLPYVAHTLEGNTTERLVINLRELDCSTFMETSMALALTARMLTQDADTFALYCHNLQQIRYTNGVIQGYPSRLHYISEWANDNLSHGLIEDITALHSPDSYPVRIGFMSKNPEKYAQLAAHPEFIAPIRIMEERCNKERFAYLPKAKLPVTGKSWIKEGDLIGLVTTIEGLDISHVGIAVYIGKELHLMHASSLQKKVIVDPRPLSVQISGKTCPGIRVFRLKSPIIENN